MLILCNSIYQVLHHTLLLQCVSTVSTSIHETLLRCSKYLSHLFAVKYYLDFALSVLIRQKRPPFSHPSINISFPSLLPCIINKPFPN